MLFNSFPFIYLFIITFSLYYGLKTKWTQVLVLTLSSLTFYSFNNLPLVILLLASAVINTFSSYYVVYSKESSRRKLIATVGVILNLMILAFFKYSPLIASTFFPPSASISQLLINIPLPIGISFFTFQGISLVVDVYSGRYSDNLIKADFKEHAQESLFYISFFPQLIAGPIVKAHDFLPQIELKHWANIQWERAFKLLITGYFLKMVVADNLKDFTSYIDFPYFQYQWSVKLLFMLFGYSCQIFADFAGYSLIAIGLATLLGYNFQDNFNFPYISTTFSEFWRRWHISLSTFLKEYLYIPLGGNRKGKIRTYANLMTTMILGGLWHGAAWSYAVWGLFHGLALGLERLLKDVYPVKIENRAFVVFKTLFVFFMVTLAWLLFKLPNFEHAVMYIQKIGTNWGNLVGIRGIPYIVVYSLPIVIYHVIYLIKDTHQKTLKNIQPFLYGTMLFLIIVNSGSSGAFIYFQF